MAGGGNCRLPIANCRLKKKRRRWPTFQSAIGNWQSAIPDGGKFEILRDLVVCKRNIEYPQYQHQDAPDCNNRSENDGPTKLPAGLDRTAIIKRLPCPVS